MTNDVNPGTDMYELSEIVPHLFSLFPCFTGIISFPPEPLVGMSGTVGSRGYRTFSSPGNIGHVRSPVIEPVRFIVTWPGAQS